MNNWLISKSVIGITNLNTRKLTVKLREKGALRGAIISKSNSNFSDVEVLKKIKNWNGIVNTDLASKVSVGKPAHYNKANKKDKNRNKIRIVAIDYGCKQNILKLIVNEGFEVILVPSSFSFQKIMNFKPSGIFLSNGPGDPLQR